MNSGERPSTGQRNGAPGNVGSSLGQRGQAGERVTSHQWIAPRNLDSKYSVPQKAQAAAPPILSAHSAEARSYYSSPSVGQNGQPKAGFVNVAAQFHAAANVDQPGAGGPGGPNASVPGSLPGAGSRGYGPGTRGSGSFSPGANYSYNSVAYYGYAPAYYNTFPMYWGYEAGFYSPVYCHSWFYASMYNPAWAWPASEWERFYVGRPWWTGCFVLGGVSIWTTAVYPWEDWNYSSCMVYPGYWDAAAPDAPYYTVTGPSYYEDARYVRVLERNHVGEDRYDSYLVNKGVYLAQHGQWDRAMTKWQNAVDANPDNPTAHYDLGVGYETQGNYLAALKEYRTASTIAPNSRRYGMAAEDIADRYPNVAEMADEETDRSGGYGFLPLYRPPTAG